MPPYYLIIVYSWIGLAIFTFAFLFKVNAPYGRHTSDRWGVTINNRWGWVIMELPSPLAFSYFFFSGESDKPAISYFFLGLWLLHYTNRTLIYPFRQKDTGKRMPLIIALSAIFFNCMNGFICGAYLGNNAFLYTYDWLGTPQFALGFSLFIIGFTINQWADTRLLNLRKPGETGYKIPKGGLFEYISCPNHFGEIIEWAGYVIMLWSLPVASFAIWTFANLAPRAIRHHHWYHKKFPNYPTKRRAIIPFLW